MQDAQIEAPHIDRGGAEEAELIDFVDDKDRDEDDCDEVVVGIAVDCVDLVIDFSSPSSLSSSSFRSFSFLFGGIFPAMLAPLDDSSL